MVGTALVLWDWNGTLLDDMQYAMNVRNATFPPLGLLPAKCAEEYREQFTFPIREYYRRCGVTDERFVEVAHIWMKAYLDGMHRLSLFPDARQALRRLADAGLRQTVLSASRLETLRYQLFLAGVLHRFDAVLGLGDIYAASKTEIGKRYLRQSGYQPEECVMLGDTLHDAEVARELGCRCVLIARGHQNRPTLASSGVPVCDTLTEATELLLRDRGE